MESETPDPCPETMDYSDLRGSPFGFWANLINWEKKLPRIVEYFFFWKKKLPRIVEYFFFFALNLIGISVFLFIIRELLNYDYQSRGTFSYGFKSAILWLNSHVYSGLQITISGLQFFLSLIAIASLLSLFIWPIILKLFPNINFHIDYFQQFKSSRYLSYSFGILIILIILTSLIKWDDPFLLYVAISIVTILIMTILMMSLIQIKKMITIQEIENSSGKQQPPFRGIGLLLTNELNDTNKLYNAVNLQRIPAKHLHSNYPESMPPVFKTKDITADYGNIKEEIFEIKGVQVPFKFVFAFIKKLIGGCHINVTINSIHDKHFITAEMVGSFNYVKHKEPDGKIKLLYEKITGHKFQSPSTNNNEFKSPANSIWQVELSNNPDKNVSDNKHLFFNQIRVLGNLIYKDVFLDDFNFRPEAVRYFNDGLRAYRDAIHQPFLRRQLLTDAKCCFRNAIQEDDCFYHAIHNLGIVYLDLGMEAQAEKMFNSAIDKQFSYRDSCYAFASSLFDPIRNVYASMMKKFLGPDINKGPFVNLQFKDVYRNFDEVNKINNEICDKAISLCSGVIESAYPDYLTILALNLRSSIYMYLGKTDLFFTDCRSAVELGIALYRSLNYGHPSLGIYRKGLVNSLQNFAMVCMREAERKAYCKVDSKTYSRPKSKIDDFNNIIKTNYPGYYKNAIKATELAERLEPEDTDTYYIRGRVHFEFQYYDKAKRDLKRATNLQPDNFNYRANYAASMIADKDPDDLYQLKWTIHSLFNCPSQIRHESMERISKISKDNMNNISKEYRELIEYSIDTAKIFTCIAHHIDQSPIIKSMFLIYDGKEVYYKLKDLFDSTNINCNVVDFELNDIRNDIDKKCDTKQSGCLIEQIINSISKMFPFLFGNYNLESEIFLTINKLDHWIRGQLYAIVGRVFMMKGRFDISSCCFKNAICYLDDFPEEIKRQKLYSSNGYSLSRKKINSIFDISKCISEALSEDPLDPMAYFASGMTDYNKENYLAARESFHKALSLSPEPKWNPVQLWYENPILIQQADLYMYFGISSIKLAESKRLKEYRTKALEDGIQAFSSLINILNVTSQIDSNYPYRNSIEIVSIEKRDSVQKKAHYWLGKAYFLKGLYQEAIEHLCLSDQKSFYPIFYIARSYHLSHELCKAIECFNKIIGDKNKKLRGGDWAEDSTYTRKETTQLSQLYRACCHAATNQLNEAEKDESNVKKEIDHNNKYNNYRAHLESALQVTDGIIEYHRGCFSDSIKLLSQALSNSTDPIVLDYLQLSFIHPFLDNSDESQARTCLLKAEAISKMGESVNVSVVDNKILKTRADRLGEIVQPGNKSNQEPLKLLISNDNEK